MGKTGEELRAMDDAGLRELKPVSSALVSAREQVQRYREALVKKFSEAEPRCYTVVAVGLERVVGEEVS